MGTVATTTYQTATATGNQRKEAVASNGVLWEAHTDGDNAVRLNYSTDGTTWSSGGYIPVGAQVLDVDIFIDQDDNLHAVATYYAGGVPGIQYYFGTLNSTKTSYTQVSGLGVFSSSGVSCQAPKLAAHRNGTGWSVHIVFSYQYSGTYVRYSRLLVSSTGTVTLDATAASISSAGSGQPTFPSIAFRHIGDEKTIAGSQPDLFVCWSAGQAGSGYGLRYRKANYAGGSWTWGTEISVDPDHYWTSSVIGSCFFDGTRTVIAGSGFTGSQYDTLVHDIDASTGAVSARNLVPTPAATTNLITGTATYDGNTKDVFIFGNSSNSPYQRNYRRWTRSTNSLGPIVNITTSGNSTAYMSSRLGGGSRIDFIYADGTSGSYTITSGSITLNTAPNAPTAVLAAGATAFDAAQPLGVTWTFSDPDSGDSQSGFDVRYRVQGASSWVTPAALTGVTSTTSAAAIPGATFTVGQVAEVQVQTRDQAGAPSGWGPSAFSTAGTAPTVTITAPSAGATVSASATLSWSPSAQGAYRWRRVADNAGAAVPGTVYADSGVITGATTSIPISFDVNGRAEHVQLAVQSPQGIWSTWADVRVVVSFTPPAAPGVSVAVVAVPAPGLAITWTAPTPTGSQPTVDHVDIFIDDGLGDGPTRRAAGRAAAGTWTYLGARGGGFDYTGRVTVQAIAANGTSSLTTV